MNFSRFRSSVLLVGSLFTSSALLACGTEGDDDASSNPSLTSSSPTSSVPSNSPTGASTPQPTMPDGGETNDPLPVVPIPTIQPNPLPTASDNPTAAGGNGGAVSVGPLPNGSAGSDGGAGGSDLGAGGSSGTGGSDSAGEGGADAQPQGGAPAGGSGGEPGAGGMPGSVDSPCPTNGDPCKILPLGDSITDGFGTPGGYRIELYQLALDAAKNITFVGGSMNGPNEVDGEPFPRAHEGHSGWTIQQIDGIVPNPALGVDPHIILLHIGTNDMYQMPQGAPERLATLLDQIIADSPDALLVVSNIIPLPGSAGAVNTYNAAVVEVVQERINQGARVIFVDQFEGFPNSELDDGIHPNPAGYARMAGVWFEAIEPYLN